MKRILTALSSTSCLLLFFSVGDLSAQSAQNIYSTNFTGTTINNSPNPYIGGYYGNRLAFGTWTGDTTKVKIVSGELSTSSDSGIRSAGIVLDPTLFASTGTEYVLSFDISSFIIGEGSGPKGDTSLVTIWQGSGYNLALPSSAEALVVDTQIAALRKQGNAVVSKVASETYTTTGRKSIAFTYDGSSAVAIFLGSQADGYPYPTTVYDNLSLDSVAVPEPSSFLLLGLSSLALLRRKRM